MRSKTLIFLLILSSLLLASCSKSSDSGATTVVEKYLNALVTKNDADLSTLSCADWESQATMQLDSFAAVTARLDGCHLLGQRHRRRQDPGQLQGQHHQHLR